MAAELRRMTWSEDDVESGSGTRAGRPGSGFPAFPLKPDTGGLGLTARTGDTVGLGNLEERETEEENKEGGVWRGGASLEVHLFFLGSVGEVGSVQVLGQDQNQIQNHTRSRIRTRSRTGSDQIQVCVSVLGMSEGKVFKLYWEKTGNAASIGSDSRSSSALWRPRPELQSSQIKLGLHF